MLTTRTTLIMPTRCILLLHQSTPHMDFSLPPRHQKKELSSLNIQRKSGIAWRRCRLRNLFTAASTLNLESKTTKKMNDCVVVESKFVITAQTLTPKEDADCNSNHVARSAFFGNDLLHDQDIRANHCLN